MGESGSGKSTIVQLLERFYDPDGGRVLVNGRDLRELALHAWRARVGSSGRARCSRRRRSVIRSPPGAATSASAAARRRRSSSSRRCRRASTRSSGRAAGRCRATEAAARDRRALVKRPALLLLDEATSALDNASEKLVQKTIDGLQQGGGGATAAGLTVISIAHRLSTVRNADCIFVLQRGEIVERGAHAELVALAGVYHALTKAQAAADDVDAATATAGASGASASAGVEVDVDVVRVQGQLTRSPPPSGRSRLTRSDPGHRSHLRDNAGEPGFGARGPIRDEGRAARRHGRPLRARQRAAPRVRLPRELRRDERRDACTRS